MTTWATLALAIVRLITHFVKEYQHAKTEQEREKVRQEILADPVKWFNNRYSARVQSPSDTRDASETDGSTDGNHTS